MQERNDSDQEKPFLLILHFGILSFLTSFYLEGNQQQKKDPARGWILSSGVHSFCLSICISAPSDQEDTGLFRVATP